METMNLIPTKKPSKLGKFMKTPLKLLAKARDLYIIGMGGIGGVIGSPTGQVVNSLPKSYSVNSSRSSNYNEDYRELVRAASTRLSNGNDRLQRQPSKNSSSNNNNNNNKMPRSFSVGIGRIAEDKPCDFDDEIKVKPADVFPRSRSYAVGSTRTTGNGFKR